MIAGIQPQLSEAGKIKIGAKGEERKSKTGNVYRLPVKLDHFLITKNNRDDRGDYELDDELMTALTGEGKLTSIPIVLHSDDIDEVFPTAYAMYSGKKVICRGDGQSACRWETQKGKRTGRKKNMDCPCEYLGAKGKAVCKPHGALHCSIAIKGYAVAGAVHKWRTTSIISIQRMIGSLQQILAVCGTLRGIPLWLKLEPVQVSPDNAPSSTVYCCHVELRASDLLEVQRKALELAQMRSVLGDPSKATYKALISPPAGPQETAVESAEVQEEFFPDDSHEIIMPDTGEVIGPKQRFTASSDDAWDWGYDEMEYEDTDSTEKEK